MKVAVKKIMAFVVVSLFLAGSLVLFPKGTASPMRSVNDSAYPVPAIPHVAISWDRYHSYNATNSLTMALFNITNAYPSIIKLYSIGKSWYGRDIWAVKISDNPGIDEDEPEILFDGLHHSREWLSMEVCLYFIWYMAENYAANTTIKNIVDNNQIWVLPAMNPDGRQFDANHDGIDPTNFWGSLGWRKNQRDNNNNGIFDDNYDGVDVNRNYDSNFGGIGSSPDPASDTYHGPYAFSEPEARALRNLVYNHTFQTYVTLHAPSQLILYPWGYNSAAPPTVDNLQAVGAEIQSRIPNNADGGSPFPVKQWTGMYTSSGISIDWLYDTMKVPLPYTIEVYGGGNNFHPPADKVETVCLDTLNALIYMCTAAGNPYMLLNKANDAGVFMLRDISYNATYGAGTVPFRVFAENYGTGSQAPFNVHIEIRDETDTVVYQDTKPTSKTLSQDQRDIIQCSYDFTTAGKYKVTATTLLAGDEYSYNDARTMPIQISNLAPGFSVAAAPPSRTINQTEGATFTITVTSTNGFNSPVTLSCEGLGSGATGVFNPNPVTPPPNGQVTSTLTITTTAGAQTGTFQLYINSTAGSMVHGTTVSLTVNPMVPEFETVLIMTISAIMLATTATIVVNRRR